LMRDQHEVAPACERLARGEIVVAACRERDAKSSGEQAAHDAGLYLGFATSRGAKLVIA
jgi:hypothetical protein